MRTLTLKTERLTDIDVADLVRVAGGASGQTCITCNAGCESRLLQCNTQLGCLLTYDGCLTGSGCG